MHIRAFRRADTDVAANLLKQLGYEIATGELEARIEGVLSAANHHVVVAEEGGKIVGLLHVFERAALEKPREAVVQALVVDSTERGRGIGSALMEAAEAWTKARHLHSLVVSTRQAASFYTRLGYGVVATADLLRKPV
jgi:N-acetylglutamate synthase-like GNAT family acetyltransferase